MDGASVQTLQLDLVANGLCWLIEMGNFELVRSFDELSKMRTTVQKLVKVKEAVDLVVASITRFVKKRNTNNIVQVPPPERLTGPLALTIIIEQKRSRDTVNDLG